MATLASIRGMLLEEAALRLLRAAGYKTVTDVGNDATLGTCAAGINVKGRGCKHQIDAIADNQLTHPFSYTQRLLVEAKCYREKVGLEVIRNAVGVLKDVSEFWVSQGGGRTFRYHYQYAVFAPRFTREAQRYAFAQDIYLFPLEGSAFFRPILEAVRGIGGLVDDENNVEIEMNALRRYVRHRLEREIPLPQIERPENLENVQRLEPFFIATRAIGFGLFGVLGGGFSVFLVPEAQVRVQGLHDEYRIRVFRDAEDRTWLIRDADSGRNLFSFGLPRELFRQFARSGMLTPMGALDLKQYAMSQFFAFYVREDAARVINFRLDADWLVRLRNDLR